MPHDDRYVQEDQVLPGMTGTPSEPGDHIADLLGPLHVVVPKGP